MAAALHLKSHALVFLFLQRPNTLALSLTSFVFNDSLNDDKFGVIYQICMQPKKRIPLLLFNGLFNFFSFLIFQKLNFYIGCKNSEQQYFVCDDDAVAPYQRTSDDLKI